MKYSRTLIFCLLILTIFLSYFGGTWSGKVNERKKIQEDSLYQIMVLQGQLETCMLQRDEYRASMIIPGIADLRAGLGLTQ